MCLRANSAKAPLPVCLCRCHNIEYAAPSIRKLSPVSPVLIALLTSPVSPLAVFWSHWSSSTEKSLLIQQSH